jgi:hypothetical protein
VTPPDCCLTVIVPTTLEDDLVDCLLEHPEWVAGFVIERVEGTGQTFALTGLRERVRGRAPRFMVQVVMAREDAERLIAVLRAAFPTPDAAYWITPVLAFGRLG